jgi:uridine kinase
MALGSGVKVGIDGVDGSGKTHFAAALAERIASRPVVVVHADDFLNPAVIRHARGRDSPEGFWLDTYDYSALRSTIRVSRATTPADAVIVVEGMFLHGDELVDHWDLSVFLDVPFAETARRMAARDGSLPDPDDPTMRRYVGGQRLYFDAVRPWERATFVVDNTDCDAPRIIEPSSVSALR